MNDASARKQLAWVVDLNKCIGCQTCSVACKVLWTQEDSEESQWWCTVNTLPGQGVPRGWEDMGGGYDAHGEPRAGRQPTPADYGGAFEFNYEEVLFDGSRDKPHLGPQGSRENRWSMNWEEDQGGGAWPNSYYFYMPRLCNHCNRPACAEACPSGALQKTDDGLVIRDESICAGSRFCIEACPYKKVYFNYERHVSQQCIGCLPRIEDGIAPACARQCPGRAVFVGWLNDEGTPVHRLVKEWEVALPLHPEYGTRPSVYYVPPMLPHPVNDDMSINTNKARVPPEYLESLFGEGVHDALATLRSEMDKTKQGGSSELMTTLIAYHWKELMGPFDVDPADVIATG